MLRLKFIFNFTYRYMHFGSLKNQEVGSTRDWIFLLFPKTCVSVILNSGSTSPWMHGAEKFQATVKHRGK